MHPRGEYDAEAEMDKLKLQTLDLKLLLFFAHVAILLPTSVIYYFFLYSIAIFPTKGQLKRTIGGCIIFKTFSTLVIFSGVSIFMWDFILFQTYATEEDFESTKTDKILSMIMGREIGQPEAVLLTRGLWIIWIWTLI